MPVEGAGGESGTTTHRLANRAQRRAGERRAPGSRSQNTGMRGQAGGSMAGKGPGRRIDASKTPFNRMRHSAARENNKGTREQKQNPAEQENHQENNGSAGPGTRAGKSVQTGKQQPRQKAGRAQAGRGGERVWEAGRTGQGGGEAGRMEQEGGEARGTGDRGGWGLGAGGGGCTREAETSATDSSSAGHARTRTQQGAAQSARTDSVGAARPPAERAGRPPPPAHQLPEHGAPPGSATARNTASTATTRAPAHRH